MHKIRSNKKKGFSLIEVIVVISVIALVIPAVYAIVFSILKQQIQLYQLTEVKRQGDFALSTMQNALRPVEGVDQDENPLTPNDVCVDQDYTGQMFFRDQDGIYFQFSTTTNKLVYRIDSTDSFLTNDKVVIENLEITCKRSSESPAVLVLKFNIKYNTQQAFDNSLTYSSRVLLRNY